MPEARLPSANEPADTAILPSGFVGRALACRRGERRVFRGLDFGLMSGGALVLTGPNGSGKSSLLRVMAGLTPLEAGTLFWNGADLKDEPASHRARVHFIGHADALKPVLSAEEMLRFWAGLRGGKPDVAGALAQFGLAGAAELPCRYLSAGQRRRLALARLVASAAPLWLLDEPANGLDSEAMAQLLVAIANHRRSGGMVVLSTHTPLELPGAASLAMADFRPRPQDRQDDAA